MRHRWTSEEVKKIHQKRKENRQKRLLQLASKKSLDVDTILNIFTGDEEKLPLLTGKGEK